ncbi:kinesin light chain [Truncatella angustata]|uniref:Kinesin light chain n=1 Tax=Truncatella angustata TaxID=152316 RepID=A0A9P8RHU3_9PEZI|nr:kinesin light chain [Truncatella angustata]KAH6646122.1 kinesin light chain [Truncatella angustata]
MRLLQRDDAGNYSLTRNLASDDVPPYAILSHTWGPDEVVFADIAKTPGDWQRKPGFDKIKFCANQARRHGLRHFWVDTCCIDKSDSIELQTAINSMFRWYRDASRCYVYLPDVSCSRASSQPQSVIPWEDTFRTSRWFTRGWTLQELIAPRTVDFHSKEGSWLGDKRTLEPLIRDITNIPASALRGTPLSDFTIAEREAWVRGRQTTHEEDIAYSLLGIFDVHMPLIYGEGREKAQRRLREEAQKAVVGPGTRVNDFSVSFSLSEVFEVQHFVARERELAEMRRNLSSDGRRRIVVLHGLGGIGKTQLVVAYTTRYRDEYSAIFWLNIKDEVSIRQSFTKAAMQILRQHPNASGLNALDLQQNHEEVIEAVKAWLSLPGNTRWLIVYDNYDDPRLANHVDGTGIDINRFLPTSYQGSILVTTRLSQVDIGHRVRVTKLESVEDSLEILSTTSGRRCLGDDMVVRDLVETLDGLPLALATAGAYLRHVPVSFSDYLRLYQGSWARLHANTPSLGSYQDRTLTSTWQLSYEQIKSQSSLAANLLQWWAYFDNEDVWFELLLRDSDNGPAWINELHDELNFNSAMGILHDYGFVEPHSFTSDQIESRGYSIHACLHSWTIHILNQDWDGELNKLAVECIASRVPSENDDQFWLIQRRLLSHAMISCATIPDSDEGVDWAFHNLGNLYKAQGKMQEAEEMYLRALRGQGKMQEAEEMCLRAFRGYEKAWGPDHTSTLSTVNNLGNLYSDQGKLQEAEEMYLRALRGKEKAWGPDHTSTLDTVNNLGLLYSSQGKMQEAEEMYLRALRGYEKAQGKMQEAEEMYLRALRGKEKVWGPDHTLTLDTVNNLGNLYSDQGKMQEAEEMYLRALRGYEKAVGPQHIARYRPAINTLWGFGALLWKQGRPVEARTYYQRAYDNLTALLGSQHHDVQSLHKVLVDLNQNIYGKLIFRSLVAT